MDSDEVENNGFLEGFESDSIIQQDLQRTRSSSKRESNVGIRWVPAVPDEGAIGFLAIRNRIEERFSF